MSTSTSVAASVVALREVLQGIDDGSTIASAEQRAYIAGALAVLESMSTKSDPV